METRLAAVVLNYNDSKTTGKLVSLFEKYQIIEKIVIVDNCSSDNSYQILTQYNGPKTDVIRSDRNGGYGYGNNYGIKYLNNSFHPTHILISNPDIEVEEHVLLKMLDVFSKDEQIAVVAPFMLNRDGKREPGTAWKIPSKYEYILSAGLLCGHFFRLSQYRGIDKINDKDNLRVDCVAGSLLMVDNCLMTKYGMYDENIFLFGEETTLGCKFKRAGLKTILLLQDCFLHLHGVSINKSIGSEIRKRKLILSSREYILKNYLGANSTDLIFAKLIYTISMLEFRILLALKSVSQR